MRLFSVGCIRLHSNLYARGSIENMYVSLRNRDFTIRRGIDHYKKYAPVYRSLSIYGLYLRHPVDMWTTGTVAADQNFGSMMFLILV